MNISEERFDELISLYLDNRASVKQLCELADCIATDAERARKFEASKCVHIATCKYFGKEPNLHNLDKFSKNNRRKEVLKKKTQVIVGWTKVAALMALTFGLLSISTHKSSSASSGMSPNIIEQAQSSYNFEIASDDFFNGSDFSIMKISPKKPTMPISK